MLSEAQELRAENARLQCAHEELCSLISSLVVQNQSLGAQNAGLQSQCAATASKGHSADAQVSS